MIIASELRYPRRTAMSFATDHPWLLSAVLCIPVYLLYLSNFFGLPPGLSGTGFVQGDQPSYMADARAYFADGKFALTYRLPYSVDPNTPPIYFQPTTALLGTILYISKLDPGIVYLIAGLLFAVVCGRVIIAWYVEVIDSLDSAAFAGLVCFFWGGGLFTFAALCMTIVFGRFVNLTFFDPFGGQWMLNLGRNLVFALEAFYHLIFLLALLLFLRRRYIYTLICAALMAASHPFYGAELTAILFGAGVLRVITDDEPRNRRAILSFLFAVALIGVVHFYYYMYYLNSVSEEYRSVSQQFMLGMNGWAVPWISYVLSIALVAPFAASALLRQWQEHRSFTERQRLLMVVCIGVFALGHHDLFIKPIQPAHFLHGYDWTALFLLGAGDFTNFMRERKLSKLNIALIVVLFLSDNIVWIGRQVAHPLTGMTQYLGMVLTDSERSVLADFRDGARFQHCVVLSQDGKLGYLVLVYTPFRSYYSHWAETPAATAKRRDLDKFLATGETPAVLSHRCVLAILEGSEARRLAGRLAADGYGKVSSNGSLTVYGRDVP